MSYNVFENHRCSSCYRLERKLNLANKELSNLRGYDHHLSNKNLRTIMEAYGQIEIYRQRLMFIQDSKEKIKLAKEGLNAINHYLANVPEKLLEIKLSCNPELLKTQCLEILAENQ